MDGAHAEMKALLPCCLHPVPHPLKALRRQARPATHSTHTHTLTTSPVLCTLASNTIPKEPFPTTLSLEYVKTMLQWEGGVGWEGWQWA